jgi:hypothetical protein
MRCALWTNRPRMPSANVGSPIYSCQRETGSCEVRIVDRTWYRSSQISQKSRRSGSESGAITKSSITSASIRLSRANKLRRLPSARAIARSREQRLGTSCKVPSNHRGTPSVPEHMLQSFSRRRLAPEQKSFRACRPRRILASTSGSHSYPAHGQYGSRSPAHACTRSLVFFSRRPSA